MKILLIILITFWAFGCCDKNSDDMTMKLHETEIVERGGKTLKYYNIYLSHGASKCMIHSYTHLICDNHWELLSKRRRVKLKNLRDITRSCPNRDLYFSCRRRDGSRRGVNPYVGPRLLRRGPGRISPF